MARPPQRMQPQGGAGRSDPGREDIPGAGGHPQLFQITKWLGINTKEDRTAIDDEEFSWLENFLPIGDGNLQCLFTNNTPIYSQGGGLTILEFYWFNISIPVGLTGAPSFIAAVLFLSDGSAVIMPQSGIGAVTILSAGTLNTSPPADFAQWGSQGILIVSQKANSYFAWDLANTYTPASAAPPWLTGTTEIQLQGNTSTSVNPNQISNIAPGTAGVSVGQMIFSFAFPTGTFVTAVTSGTVLTVSNNALSTNTGINFNVGATFTTTGNTHSNTVVDNMGSTSGLFAGMLVFGSGIASGTTITQIVSSSSINISQNAGSTLVGTQLAFQWPMPVGVSGNAISIFQNRVFVHNGNSTQISAPSNGANFAAAQGGTSFTSSDSFLKQQYTKSAQSNGFQYIIGDSSINVISNIQTGGSPTQTTFNNQNVDQQMGSLWKDTVQSFGRGIMFANPSGIYALYGGAAEKVSDHLDGLFASANFTAVIPSCAIATIFGVRIFAFNFRAVDFMGNTRNMMALWDGKKFFMGSQSLTTTFIQTQEINSVINMWGTDGINLFEMYQTPSATLPKVLQTKLWMGDGYVIFKQAMRNFCLGTDFSGNGYSLSGTIDMISDVLGFLTAPTTLIAPLQFVQWQNNSHQNVQFQNSFGGNVNFLANAVLSLLGQNVNASGALLGETLTSTSSDFTLAALTLQYRRQAPVGG